MTLICVSKLTSIGLDNGLSPGRRQAIIWTYAGILLIGPLGTDFSEILTEIYTFPFKKMHLNMSSGKWRTFCLGLNVLKMMMAWHGNTFSITDSLWGNPQLTSGFPSQNINNAELWYFISCYAEQIIEFWVIWDSMTIMWYHSDTLLSSKPYF